MQTQPPFRSLRLRLLAPMILSALLAALLVAAASYDLGNRWASEQLQTRFEGIRASLSDSSFPLNATVLELLADLTQTELVGIGGLGQIRYSTVDIENGESFGATFLDALPETAGQTPHRLSLRGGQDRYRVFMFATLGGASRQDRIVQVAVLFDETQLEASLRRAVLLPLATGLSVIVALSSITLVLSSRLIGRIETLQRRVERVAGGDFQSTVADHVSDEIGRLGRAVDSMAGQLDGLWNQVNRQQSEKLLHQIAGGMAHQLRNSLTGARMAVELHALECPHSHDEGIRVAISQIELSEDYVRRLLLVASGRQDADRPTEVLTCFNDVRNSLTPIAKHLRRDLNWRVIGSLENSLVQDGPTWVAAVTNLIQNAMQAGDRVEVTLSLMADELANTQYVQVRVADNGPGVLESVAVQIFEPFVTSKPEGMGLGLSVVKRAALSLQGEVRWRREQQQTVFELDAAIVPTKAIS